MQQQINLYHYLSRKSKFFLTLEMAITLSCLFLLLLFVNLLYELWNKHELTAQVKKSNATFIQTQQHLITLLKQYPSIDIKDLEKSVQDLQADLIAKAKVFDLLVENARFASYLTGLANAVVPGVWLVDISFSNHMPHISLRGHALQPEQTQQFIEKLMQQATFFDMTFELQELTQAMSEQDSSINFYITSKVKNGYE